MKTISAILLLLCASRAQHAIESWQIPCNEEIVQPNLEIKVKQRIFGQLKDSTGAAFEKSKVLLRRENEKGKLINYRSVLTDKNGNFDLNTVEPGHYRFLPAPHRGWRQPKRVACGSDSECEIKLELEVNPTDQPFAGCPIQ